MNPTKESIFIKLSHFFLENLQQITDRKMYIVKFFPKKERERESLMEFPSILHATSFRQIFFL